MIHEDSHIIFAQTNLKLVVGQENELNARLMAHGHPNDVNPKANRYGNYGVVVDGHGVMVRLPNWWVSAGAMVQTDMALGRVNILESQIHPRSYLTRQEYCCSRLLYDIDTMRLLGQLPPANKIFGAHTLGQIAQQA